MPMDTWISRSNQAWKLLVFFILMVLDASLFVLFVWRINASGNSREEGWFLDEVTLVLVFVSLGWGAFCWLLFSIRCSVCRKSVAGQIIKSTPASEWFSSLITIQECRSCGSNGMSGRKV